MNIIKSIIQIPLKWFKYHQPNQLGRWSRLESEKQLNYRVTMTIEDHCGPCGEYIVKKYEKNKLKQTIYNNKNY